MISLCNKIINRIYSVSLLLLILLIWCIVSGFNLIPKFLLPSPIDIIKSFISDLPLVAKNLTITLIESFSGLIIAIIISFVVSYLMDRYQIIKKSVYPVLIISQTIPTVAIAPILVLWFGYNAAPKIILVSISCFFPICISLFDGFRSVDIDSITLMKSMGGSEFDIFKHIKLPYSLGSLFSGLKISVSYSIIGAVIAEWLGGYRGLGVYMLRAKKSYEIDKMFASIIIISLISLILIRLVSIIQVKFMPWKKVEKL